MDQSAVAKLEQLNLRRERLIADRARLEERVKQNDSELKTVRKKLEDLGIKEGELAPTIEKLKKDLTDRVAKFEADLVVEEQKVSSIKSKLEVL